MKTQQIQRQGVGVRTLKCTWLMTGVVFTVVGCSSGEYEGLSEVERKKAEISNKIEKYFAPDMDFDPSKSPAKPDYSQKSAWAALPTVEDEADELPENTDLKDGQANAEVDVFYVHPTTFFGDDAWNAPHTVKIKARKFTPIRFQAGIFNESAKVYAPRYRQATLYTFIDMHGDSGNGKNALEVARDDIKAAFDYYMKNYNNGRPFVLAGHSQGAYALLPILELLDKQPNPLFVTAYVPGAAVYADQYNNIKPCASESEVGCYSVWNTKRWGTTQEELTVSAKYTGSDCVNPMNWKMDGSVALKEQHLGALPPSFDGFDRNAIEEAKCDGETLWIKIDDDYDYHSSLDENWYHAMDFNLFYLNVRENVKKRIEHYKLEHGA